MCSISLLNTVTEHEYLGICLHHKLSWSSHVDHVQNKANCWVFWNEIYIMHQHRSKNMYISSYCCLLLSTAQLYGTRTITQIKNKLEMIQRYVARFVLNKPWHRQQQNDSVTDMLTYLKWPSLEYRRKISHHVLLFKIRSKEAIYI